LRSAASASPMVLALEGDQRERRRGVEGDVAAGINDLRIHHDQVLLPVLVKHRRLRELRGLSEAAERARDAMLHVTATRRETV
jgi:hypothetical protein